MKLLAISTSLDPTSRSRILTNEAAAAVSERGHACPVIDLRELELPRCDAADCWTDPVAIELKAQVEQADGLILGVPIYNYDVGATARLLLELTGRAWAGKVAGFVCAAGGRSSYMGVMSIANSLMLEFRTVIVPRFVYATGASFTDEMLVDEAVAERVGRLADDLIRMTDALRGGD